MRWSPRVRGAVALLATLSVSAFSLVPGTVGAASSTSVHASLASYLAHRGVVTSSPRHAHAGATVTVTPNSINTPSGGLSTVSCPKVNFCVAVDNNGGALTYNGTAWAGPVTIDSGVALDAVSCSAVTFCVATDVNGNYIMDNAGSWGAPTPFVSANAGADLALSISCPSATYCLALGMTTNTSPVLPDVMFYDNGTWHQQTYNNVSDDVFDAVSCVSRSMCMAVTFGGYYVNFAAPNVNGASESASASNANLVDSADAVSGLTSVSCASTNYCAVADGAGDLFLDVSNTWSVTLGELPLATNGFVSCSTVASGSVSGNNCIAIDDVGESAATSGTGWLSGDAGSANDAIVAFVCANDANCLGVDYNGFSINVVETLAPYSLSTTQFPQTFDQPDNVTTLSCVTTNAAHQCFAGDAAGNIYTSNGSPWAGLGQLVVNQSAGVVSLSCAGSLAAYQCWALDSSGNPYRYDQGYWTSILPGSGPLNAPVAISCSAVANCVAVDQSFDVVRFSDLNTYVATVLPATDSASAVPLALSCAPGLNRCAVVDSSGYGYVTTGPNTWAMTSQFIADPTTATATALSCATATFCVAVDDTGNAYYLNGSSWSSADAVTAEPLVALSCASAYRCVATDDLGNAFIYDGSSWTEVAQVAAQGDYLASASCPSMQSCFVADSNTSYQLSLSAPTATTTTISAIPAANRTAGNLVVSIKVSGSDAPSGTVTVARGATSCVATLVAAPASANWSSASCALPAPGILGTVHLSANYHGSLNDAASQATATTTLTVEPTTTTLSLPTGTVKFGAEQKGRFSVVVAPKHVGLVPSGSVTVLSGTLKLCKIKLVKGSGSCAPGASVLARGAHKIVAQYAGSTVLTSSNSSAHTLTIK